jgi:hypothetical protein
MISAMVTLLAVLGGGAIVATCIDVLLQLEDNGNG